MGGAYFKKPRLETIDPESLVMRRMFIGKLSLDTTKDEVNTFFEQYGHVSQINFPTHKDTGRPKGFAFITFSESSSVDRVQRARPHKISGQEIETLRATPKEDLGNPMAEVRTKKIYIGGPSDAVKIGHTGLTDDMSDEDLEEYFGQYGTVVKVVQKCWPDTGKKKGFGYIEFDDEDPADKIVLLKLHEVKGQMLEAKKFVSKEEKARMDARNMSECPQSMNKVGGMTPMMGGMNNMMGGLGQQQNRGGGDMGGMGAMQKMMGNMQSMMNSGTNLSPSNMQQMQSMMTGMQNQMSKFNNISLKIQMESFDFPP